MQRVAVTAWPSQAKPNRAEPPRRRGHSPVLRAEVHWSVSWCWNGCVCQEARNCSFLYLFISCRFGLPEFFCFFQKCAQKLARFDVRNSVAGTSAFGWEESAWGLYTRCGNGVEFSRTGKKREKEKITTKQQNKHRNENGVICETRRE